MISFTKPKRAVNKVFLHCSASDSPQHDSVEVITQWHIARGFDTIGYHFLVHRNGEIEHGRDLERTPAAQQGHNTGSIAICVAGLADFTSDSLNAVRDLCRTIDYAYGTKVLTFHGHCEVSSKSCPVFNYKKLLNLDASGHIMG